MRIITSDVGHEVPISKKWYLDLIGAFASKEQVVGRDFETTGRFSADCKDRIEDLELKKQLLADYSTKVTKSKKQLAVNDTQMTTLKASCLI